MADGESSKAPPHPQDGVKQVSQHLDFPKSFAQAVQANLPIGLSSINNFQKPNPDMHNLPQSLELSSKVILQTSDQGKPEVMLPMSEKKALVGKLQYVLIGKFSHGRPPMGIIKKFFQDLKLKGNCNSTIYDNKHIFIECSCRQDYYRLWLKLRWFIAGFAMRVFKWSPDFSPAKECPIAPVWIRLEGLPLYLFDQMVLMSISSSIGKPIIVDSRNVHRTMLNSARICVELDVSKPLLSELAINFIDDVSKAIIEQLCVKVFYDELPRLCDFCCHIGHGWSVCKRRGEDDCSMKDSVWGTVENLPADQLIDVMPQPRNVEPESKDTGKVTSSGEGRDSATMVDDVPDLAIPTVPALQQLISQPLPSEAEAAELSAEGQFAMGNKVATESGDQMSSAVVGPVSLSAPKVAFAPDACSSEVDSATNQIGLVIVSQGLNSGSKHREQIVQVNAGEYNQQTNTILTTVVQSDPGPVAVAAIADGAIQHSNVAASGPAAVAGQPDVSAPVAAPVAVTDKSTVIAKGANHGVSSAVDFSTPEKGCVSSKIVSNPQLQQIDGQPAGALKQSWDDLKEVEDHLYNLGLRRSMRRNRGSNRYR